jgi:hypothetical protein
MQKVGIQNLLTELQEKQLQWFGHVKRVDKEGFSEGHYN